MMAAEAAENECGLIFDDFRKQLDLVAKLGSLNRVGRMIPALRPFLRANRAVDLVSEVSHIRAMIDSMTPSERRDPGQIDEGRGRRIARGSGSSALELRKLLADFEVMRGMMSGLAGPPP